jgi:hypothetical protein
MQPRFASVALALALLFGLPPATFAKPSKGGAARGTAPHAAKARTAKAKAPKVKAPKTPKTSTAAVARDERGRIQRSASARHAFARQTGYPNGRPGHVIDHIVPLACGGADAPSNMQWQTIAAAKAKDRTERIGCR